MQDQLNRIENKLDNLIEAKGATTTRMSWHEKAMGALFAAMLFIYQHLFIGKP
jgi:hypothetical protein